MEPIKIDDNDFRKCPDCHAKVLMVGFWDENVSRPRTMMVDLSFAYEYRRRDKMGRLVVEEREQAMRMAHSWKCPLAPAPPPLDQGEEESKPFQR